MTVYVCRHYYWDIHAKSWQANAYESLVCIAYTMATNFVQCLINKSDQQYLLRVLIKFWSCLTPYEDFIQGEIIWMPQRAIPLICPDDLCSFRVFNVACAIRGQASGLGTLLALSVTAHGEGVSWASMVREWNIYIVCIIPVAFSFSYPTKDGECYNGIHNIKEGAVNPAT